MCSLCLNNDYIFCIDHGRLQQRNSLSVATYFYVAPCQADLAFVVHCLTGLPHRYRGRFFDTLYQKYTHCQNQKPATLLLKIEMASSQSTISCPSAAQDFLKIFGFFPLTFRPLFWPKNEGAQKPPKNHQFPPISTQFLSKSHQKARKIINIRKSQCHHLNLLSSKHLTPFFSESPISPRVHSRPSEPPFFAQKSSFARP